MSFMKWLNRKKKPGNGFDRDMLLIAVMFSLAGHVNLQASMLMLLAVIAIEYIHYRIENRGTVEGDNQ